ncbi:TraG/VirD4-like conjugal transfer ATPase [Saccharolobus shibatae]|uniref:TraG/VirD4-like conjugal transfer ATPase n=2 Tax=Saccharolobus shibatae TaxID=2286 RepID=A0A8F5GUV4_9CREN|nr:TraG/VirD4-like conjugal transfer ATPase [Saccharolobus shibatae]QXJ30448.1 TraG/VirD4-like conjugal transfer ATPase [Saccharolobus shibatae]
MKVMKIQEKLKEKYNWYKLQTTPYFLLDEDERRKELFNLASLLAYAKKGMIYVSRRKSSYEFLENRYTVYITNVYLQSLDEIKILDRAEEPKRPQVVGLGKNYVVTEENTYARAFIAYAYSTQILEGALSIPVSTRVKPELIEVVIKFSIINKDRVRNYISSIDSKLAKASRFGNVVAELEALRAQAAVLKKDFDEFGAEPLEFQTIYIIHTKTLQELETATQELTPQLTEAGVLVEAPNSKSLQKQLYELKPGFGKRYSSSISIAKLYPIAASNIIEEGGVFLGVDETGAPIVINPFARVNGRSNPHWIISGTTGAGKTTTTALLIDRLKKIFGDNIYIFVIDPLANFNRFFEGDRDVFSIVWEYGDEMGLDPIALAREGGINLGDVTDFLVELYQIPGKLRGLMANYIEKSKNLMDMLANVRGDIENVNKQKLRNRNLEDLEAYLLNMSTNPDKTIYTGETPTDLLRKKTVILGLKTDDNRHKRLAATLLILLAWAQINKLPRDMKKVIIIDEAHLLLIYPSIARIIAQIYKTARNLATGIITITQLVSDYTKNEYSKDIFQLADTKLILKQEDTATQDLKDLARLSDEEIDYVLKSNTGQGILKSSAVKTFIQVLLTEEEKAKWRSGV